MLSGGALVMADGGVAVIDELDKARDGDKTALHEAMEQGQVTIQKAASGTLNARTTVIATANPKTGVWDQWEPFADQFDLPPSLVSRFDLIFTFKDEVDKARDEKIAMSVLRHRHSASTTTTEPSDDDSVGYDGTRIPKNLFRKYVAVARQITPTISEDVLQALGKLYVSLRTASDNAEAVPVTARQIDALSRLAESVARLHLSDEITMEHVKITEDLVWASLEDLGIDPETGELDSSIRESGVSRTQAERYELIQDIVTRLTEDGSEEVSEATVATFAKEEFDLSPSATKHILAKLLDSGDIYETSDSVYRLA